MAEERFREVVSEGILSLPQDMKAVLRIVEDPEVDEEGRVLLAGALIHVLSGHNAIPGQRGILAHVDDVLVLRLALERVEKTSPEAMKRHREAMPELFDPLDEQLKAFREFLGELLTVLDQAVDGCPKLNHLGHSAPECLEEDGANWLYDTVQEAVLDMELDEDEVNREVKNIDRILPHLESRVAAMKA
jgi:uncharacterized membrane protein YkvA (DUF1232 family)